MGAGDEEPDAPFEARVTVERSASEHGSEFLDLSGLKCPLPALRVRRALRRLAPGARLTVLCTDPLSGIDVPNAAREEGATVEACERERATFRFRLRRTAS